MGEACSTHGKDKKFIRYFGFKAWRKTT